MIEVQGLSKSFGKIKAVQNLSFSASNGQITGLLGPNGAGKSTTLRMLYTLLKPDSGLARIDGFDVTQMPIDVQARIGVLSDAQGIYERLTARENIRYFGKLHGLRGQKLEKRMDELLNILDMQSIANRKTEGFSTGEQLKVAIARALIHNPGNVLLDEPTNGLDVKSTRAMRQFIRKLRDDGKCILLTSHIMQEVAALCDQIIIISNGIVAAQGTSDELLHKTGKDNLEDAFIEIIGSEDGLA
ncbi:MAG: ATP-binding cassette domain-containing protein [Anaerolineales bacterium]|uniref:ATP-binding cassette domain-containing protein n=1 Tax=Candidatus Desulfolinea nitratireducens TaxID=2841698 RepID=A0A8J6NJL6_9CHLR|nr:ATP-binding cassette domain-containing protein [Candidatus Desulfolinea nitratireducens]